MRANASVGVVRAGRTGPGSLASGRAGEPGPFAAMGPPVVVRRCGFEVAGRNGARERERKRAGLSESARRSGADEASSSRLLSVCFFRFSFVPEKATRYFSIALIASPLSLHLHLLLLAQTATPLPSSSSSPASLASSQQFRIASSSRVRSSVVFARPTEKGNGRETQRETSQPAHTHAPHEGPGLC